MKNDLKIEFRVSSWGEFMCAFFFHPTLDLHQPFSCIFSLKNVFDAKKRRIFNDLLFAVAFSLSLDLALFVCFVHSFLVCCFADPFFLFSWFLSSSLHLLCCDVSHILCSLLKELLCNFSFLDYTLGWISYTRDSHKKKKRRSLSNRKNASFFPWKLSGFFFLDVKNSNFSPPLVFSLRAEDSFFPLKGWNSAQQSRDLPSPSSSSETVFLLSFYFHLLHHSWWHVFLFSKFFVSPSPKNGKSIKQYIYFLFCREHNIFEEFQVREKERDHLLEMLLLL